MNNPADATGAILDDPDRREKRKRASIRSSKPNQLPIECIKEKERKKRGVGLLYYSGSITDRHKSACHGVRSLGEHRRLCVLAFFERLHVRTRHFGPYVLALAHRDGKGVHISLIREAE